ncbi:MAG: hypothetical protein RBU30_24840, partial [Polyangia bacterium]|nr:hypothetical protein [Polyangia bacterium]
MTRCIGIPGLGFAICLVAVLTTGCGPSSTAGDPDSGTNQNDAQAQPDSAPPGDRDGDGVPDHLDPCPDDPNQWTDSDGDGRCDELDDKCPDDPDQWTDSDGDGHCDELDDKCPDDPEQWTDADGDGHCDELDDDCPDDPEGWVDTNGDGACDGDDDADGDGITNAEELVYGADCAISNPYLADSDEDGIADNEDPYPLDPFPEYILHRNDSGTIDLALSNRDGTFTAPVEIGAPHGCTTDAPHNCPVNTAYRYLSFVITDFDNDGRTDFLAIGDSNPADPSNPQDLWWFTRTGTIISGSATTFQQRLVDSALTHAIFGTAADFKNDDRNDLIAREIS